MDSLEIKIKHNIPHGLLIRNNGVQRIHQSSYCATVNKEFIESSTVNSLNQH